MTLTPEEQAALAAQAAPAAQDPPQAAPVAEAAVANAPAPQPAPVASQGPWSADLAATFADEATRGQVDEFLRQKVQPHVTRLEQESKPGAELLNDFRTQPKDTFLEVADELYGEDVAKAVRDYLDAVETAEPPAQPDPAQTDRDPEVQALIDAEKARQEKAKFDAEYARVKQANPDVELDYELFVPFVAKAGNFDDAATQYKAYLTRLREAASPAATADPADPNSTPAPAPATVGTGEAAGATDVPTQKEHQTLDEAINDFFDEQRAVGRTPAPPAPPVAV